MPLYFFDIDENGTVKTDAFGVEFDGFDEAREQAVTLLPDIARDEMPEGETYTFACTVRDARRRPLYRGTLTYEGQRLPSDD